MALYDDYEKEYHNAKRELDELNDAVAAMESYLATLERLMVEENEREYGGSR